MTNNMQLLALLERLKGHEFDPFRQHLEDMIASRWKGLEQARDPIDIYRHQGEISALRMVIRTITDDRS